ncbi:MAG: hypothetical protein V1873_00835 [Verrucomicrobiota bacterium]
MKILALGIPLLLGCGPMTQSQQQQPPPKGQPMSAGEIVDTMTQRNALEAGRKAGDKLRAVNAERQKDMDAVGGGE